MMFAKVPAPKSFSTCTISARSKGDLWVKKICWDNAGRQKHRFILKIILEEKQNLFKLKKCSIHILHKYTVGIIWLSQETAFGFHQVNWNIKGINFLKLFRILLNFVWHQRWQQMWLIATHNCSFIPVVIACQYQLIAQPKPHSFQNIKEWWLVGIMLN